LFDYEDKDTEVVGVPDPLIVRSAADIVDEDNAEPVNPLA
jgi:hypothetical protein